MYKVIYKFADLQDNGHIYEIGDIFPRDGKDVTDERIAELASDKNRIGEPLIKAVLTARKDEGKEVIAKAKKIDSEPSEKPKKGR